MNNSIPVKVEELMTYDNILWIQHSYGNCGSGCKYCTAVFRSGTATDLGLSRYVKDGE